MSKYAVRVDIAQKNRDDKLKSGYLVLFPNSHHHICLWEYHRPPRFLLFPNKLIARITLQRWCLNVLEHDWIITKQEIIKI